MSWIAVLPCLLLASSITLAQAPGVKADYGQLTKQSDVVVIGVVEGTQWVIRPDKRSNKTTLLPNGRQIVELQDSSEYVVGRVARLRVSEVLKGSIKVKMSGTINIYLPGSFPGENAPAFAERQKYLVFLSALNANVDEVAGTVVYQPGARTGGEPPFVPKSHYTVIGNSHGALRVVPENSRLVNQIRSVVRRSRG